MSKDQKEICLYCKFWAKREIGALLIGNCRIKAPRLVNDEGDDLHKAKWPSTGGEDWCGEFKERPA